jgi:hypothetical protein
MCLAIYKPAGLDIPEKNLKSGYDSNSDGCGLSWAADGELHLEKGMMTWEEFYAKYKEVSQYSMLIHFRKSTHGKKDKENCHPFLFNDGKSVLVHNGVIPIKCNEDGYSDTWHFVNKVLDPIIKRGVPIDDQALSWFIRVSIGTDKIVVMDGKGEVIIFNEEKGNWEDTDGPEGKKCKVWYSNYSFRRTTSSYTPSTNNSASAGRCQSSMYGPNRSVEVEDDENSSAEWEGYGHKSSQINGRSIEIATDENRKPGCMTEYGWYDGEIEGEIEAAKTAANSNREDAIISVFNAA